MKIKQKIERGKKKEVVTTLFCPDCGGTHLSYEAGMITGQKYHCADCHYRGTFILERKVVMKDDEVVEEL